VKTPSSAFEKLSFTKDQNFIVGWQIKLKEISQLLQEAVDVDREDFQEPWAELPVEESCLQFRLSIEKSSENKNLKIWGEYFDEAQGLVIDLWQVKDNLPTMILTNQNKIYLLDKKCQPSNIYARYMESKGPIIVPFEDLAHFFYQLFNQVGYCLYRLDSKVRLETISLIPQNILYLKTANSGLRPQNQIEGQVWFRYDKFELPALCHRSDKRLNVISYQQFIPVSENQTEELTVRLFIPHQELEEIAVQTVRDYEGSTFDIIKNIFKIEFSMLHQFIASILESVAETNTKSSIWEVWAENLKIKLLSHYQMVVRSLESGFKMEFQSTQSGNRIESWQLIHILKKKSAFVKLDDGTLGVLPQAWISDLHRLYQNIMDNGSFSSAGLFHFLNSENDFSFGIDGDENYQNIKSKFQKQLSGPSPLNPSENFNGELFEYQRHGLGWLVFLDEFNLGGLLADDMGVGKNIQVLAF
jgi:hypothetical protein